MMRDFERLIERLTENDALIHLTLKLLEELRGEA